MPCLNSQVKKRSQLHIIFKKQIFIAIKTNFTLKNFRQFMYEKKTQKNLSSLAAILDAMLYQVSPINCSQITRSHFESFYAWNNFDAII